MITYVILLEEISHKKVNGMEGTQKKLATTQLYQNKNCLDCESNTGPQDLQSCALPTELSRLFHYKV
eukprot:scaffold1248_cov221-Chaetoceros_neogracile.AAC.3